MYESTLSQNLKKLRMQHSYTQEQVAHLLSVSPQTISRWECGSTLPEVTLLPEISRLYCVTIDDLFRDELCSYPNYAQRLLAVYEESGRLEDFIVANNEFQKLLASPEHTDDDLRSYGILWQYLMIQAKEMASTYFDKVLLQDARDTVYYATWQQKISLMAKTGEGEAAIKIHEAGIKADPENPKAWVLLVAACYLSGAFSKAKNYAEEALSKFPKNAALCIYAGDICKARKEFDEAFIHWRRGLELDKRYLDPLYSMGYCYEELEQYDKACAIWNELKEELRARGLDVSQNGIETHIASCKARFS